MRIRFIGFVIFVGMFIQVGAVTSQDKDKNRIALWNEQSWYLLGVNYPWLGYGHDFGTTAWGHDGVSAPSSTSQIEADFADMKEQGVHVLRWFLFADGRASPEFDEAGFVTGFDDHFYADFDKALEIAHKNDIYLIPVLWDYLLADTGREVSGAWLGGRAPLITDPEVQQSFLDNALLPLLERYGQNKTIIAWDVMNEPEGATIVSGGDWVSESVSLEAMQSFVATLAEYIHDHSSQQVTIGSASRGGLLFWVDADLDFYQYHYYDHFEAQHPFDYSAQDLELDKPVIIGEFPTHNTSRTLTDYLDTIWQNGYAGALAWSYRAEDDFTDFTTSGAEFAIWAEAHQMDVDIASDLGSVSN